MLNPRQRCVAGDGCVTLPPDYTIVRVTSMLPRVAFE